jgi:hypothetical protein
MKRDLSSAKSDSNKKKRTSADKRTALAWPVSSSVRADNTEPVVDAEFRSGTSRDLKRQRRFKGKKAVANLPTTSAGTRTMLSTTSAATTSAEVPALEPVQDVCHTVTVGDNCFAMIQDETRAQHAQGNCCSEDQIVEQALAYRNATMYLTAILTGRPPTHCSASYLAKVRELSASSL